MIRITEGSLNSINHELLSKTISCLNRNALKNIHLYTTQKFSSMINQTYTPSENNVVDTLELALKDMEKNDILLTLPASKNDFQGLSGHTEYFRRKYNNENISMVFKGPFYNALLLTDHLPLNRVSKILSTGMIINKLKVTLDNFSQFYYNIEEVCFSGVNPHAGEGGLMGNEEKEIVDAINTLKKHYPHITFSGPLPGDTIHFQTQHNRKIFVFAHHDQGLGIFKAQHKLYGINITLGLPFLRVSPDHGTAPNLQNLDRCNYLGLYWLIQEILN